MEPVMCCFCGKTIKGETPLEIALHLPGGTTQGLCAHGDCFGKLLHPSVPYLSPREMESDDEPWR